MRNYIKKLTVLIGITIASCSSPDPDPTVILPPSTSPCTTLNQMVGIKMTNAGTDPEYQTLVFPGSNLAPVNNIPVSPNRLFTYGGAYNPTTQEYALVSNDNVSGNATLTKINTAGIQSGVALTGYFAEPLYLNNELYFGNIETVASITTFKVFDKNLVLLKSLVVNANKVFTTSTTDNSRYIYYLSEPFLITYDKLNNTLVSSDLGTGTTNLMGLEYKNPTTLLAMKNTNAGGGTVNTELISLNITTPTSVTMAPVYNFGTWIHPESYSTAYNACNNKYYISESFAGTALTEVDLNTNTKTIASLGANKIIGLAFRN